MTQGDYAAGLQRPVDGTLSFRNQVGVGFGEVAAAEKGSPCEGRGVGGFQNAVGAGVYERGLAACEISPKHIDNSAAFFAEP